MKCEFCGYKLDKTDKKCPNCGAIVPDYYDINKEVKHKDNEKKEQVKEINNKKHQKKNNLLIIAITIVLQGIFIILGFSCLISLLLSSKEPPEDPPSLEFPYDNDNSYTGRVINIGQNAIFTMNDKEYTIPMTIEDFIDVSGFDFPKNTIIKAGDYGFVYNFESSISMHVYNTTDSDLNYTDCMLGGITINFDNMENDIFVNSLEICGITLNTSPKEAVEILGEPTYSWTSEYSINEEWYTGNGYIEFYWDPQTIEIYKITIENSRELSLYN